MFLLKIEFLSTFEMLKDWSFDFVDGVEVSLPMETPLNELITDVMVQVRAKQTRKENSEPEVVEN